MSTLVVSTPPASTAAGVRDREHAQLATNVPIGYLRGFITVLVVLHHSLLAYHPFAAPPNATLIAAPRLWPAFPVVDQQRSIVSALLVGFNETFFMSLMFLLSGLFVWHSSGSS